MLLILIMMVMMMLFCSAITSIVLAILMNNIMLKDMEIMILIQLESIAQMALF